MSGKNASANVHSTFPKDERSRSEDDSEFEA
jgi:hypothetical protein